MLQYHYKLRDDQAFLLLQVSTAVAQRLYSLRRRRRLLTQVSALITMTSSLQYLEHFAGCRIAVIRALRILFFSFCFVEFLIGMQNVSIQGTSIPVRLVSYMYDMNNALNISVLIFFFLNQLGMVVFTFFFLSYPFNHPRFLQLVFLKTKTNY